MNVSKGKIIYTDRSKTLEEYNAHWVYIIKHKKGEEIRDRGLVLGTTQYVEVIAVLKALERLKEINATQVIIITDSKKVETSLNENLDIYRQNRCAKFNRKRIC